MKTKYYKIDVGQLRIIMTKSRWIAVQMTGIKNQFDIEEDKMKNKINICVREILMERELMMRKRNRYLW